MKKRITLLLSSLFVAAALCVGILAVPTAVAHADELSIESATDELLYFGDVIDSTAKVNGVDTPIIWDNLNANEVNALFSMAEAVGTIKGTNERVSRRFFTLPRGLVYFVNCGSYTDQADAGLNDVYYGLSDAILNNYEAATSDHKLLNKVPDQLNDGHWGYANYRANYPVSSKQMPAKAGDPMPPAFPFNTIRATDTAGGNTDIRYTLGDLPAGSYRVYLGTRSHWHARRVKVEINGSLSELEISSISKVTTYDNVSPNGGAISINILGASLDEGNCAFIAIQTMEEAEKMATEAPAPVTIGGNLDMGVTSFTVGNIAAGTKVQVALAEAPFNILYEGIAKESGNYLIDIPAERLENIFSLYLIAVNTFGASTPTQVYITDITQFSFSLASTAYTSDDLTINVEGYSDSGIMRLVVTHNYISTTYDEKYDKNFGVKDYKGTVTVPENGVYTFTLYSGNNAFVSQDLTITTIDKVDVSLSIDMATTGITKGKPRVAFTYEGAAPIATYVVYNDKGEVKSSGTGDPGSLDLDYGRYVFSVTSESGKIATASAIISETPIYCTVTTGKASRGESYTFKAANGKAIEDISAFSVSKSGVATRLMGVGSSVNNYSGNAAYARILYTDGTVEFAKIASGSATSSKKKGCGSAAGAASVPIALGALALCAVVIGAKRKASAK